MLTKEEATKLVQAEFRRLYDTGERDGIFDKLKEYCRDKKIFVSLNYFSVISVARNLMADLNPPDPTDILVKVGFEITSYTKVGERFVLETEHGTVNLDGESVLSFPLFRRAMLTQTAHVPPLMKKDEWEQVVDALQKILKVDIDVANDASEETVVKEAVKARYSEAGDWDISFLNKRQAVLWDGKFCFRISDLVRDIRVEHDRRSVPRATVATMLRKFGFTQEEGKLTYWWKSVDDMKKF